MNKPNFIIIGAARCATTSLHAYMQNHPDIFLSTPKEINYFAKNKFYEKGEKWYLEHFKNVKQKAIGEASTCYTSAPYIEPTPERIRSSLGENVKFIYIVRNPIDRLISHYSHYVHRGQLMCNFDTIVKEKASSLIYQGLYHYQLELFLEHFDKSQFKVITVKDLKENNEQVVRSIYEFLGVSSNLNLDFDSQVHNKNESIVEMTRVGSWLMEKYNSMFEYSSLPGPIGKLIYKVVRIGGKKFHPPVLTEFQLKDLEAFYEEDSMKLKRDWGADVT